MENVPQILEMFVKIASLDTAGISILGIFYAGIIVKSLPNDVIPQKPSDIRLFKNLCLVSVIVCSISVVLNSYFNMRKIQVAKRQTIELANQYIIQLSKLEESKTALSIDLKTLRDGFVNQ